VPEIRIGVKIDAIGVKIPVEFGTKIATKIGVKVGP